MYQNLEAALHDPFWDTEGPPAELPLLDAFLRDVSGTSLEVGCGSGRLLLPLLARGHDIEGLDPSAEMLALCRQNAEELRLAPTLHHASLEAFAPQTRYAAAAVPAFTFQLVDDPSKAIAALRGLLQPDGKLYLTTFIPWAEILGELPENEWYDDHQATLADGSRATCETRHTIDVDNHKLVRQHRYTLHPADGSARQTHESIQAVRWLFPEELTPLLEEHGFVVEDLIGDFDTDSLDTENPQILTIIARLVARP
jgi:SAM-dependent methyltransferase